MARKPPAPPPGSPGRKPSALTFYVDPYEDPETGEPTAFGRFHRNWEDEEALDVLSDQLKAGELTEKQALMQARKLEATTPYILEIQGFIGNLLWTLDLKDEAADVYERAYARARAQLPPDFRGQIPWGEVDNRPFLRIAHGRLLGLMHRHEQAGAIDEAQALATELLTWCPMDSLGVRFLRGDIAFLQGDYERAKAFYLEGAYDAPAHWYQAALIAFREEDFVTACTYLRRGIAANPYMAEGLTGRTLLDEHPYLHLSSMNGPEWAIDYLESPACGWTLKETDFVDWVFNASPVLRKRAKLMALHEAVTHEKDPERRSLSAQQASNFAGRLSHALSKKMVRSVTDRWGHRIWPWERS